jgi:hypothetical protein
MAKALQHGTLTSVKSDILLHSLAPKTAYSHVQSIKIIEHTRDSNRDGCL